MQVDFGHVHALVNLNPAIRRDAPRGLHDNKTGFIPDPSLDPILELNHAHKDRACRRANES